MMHPFRLTCSIALLALAFDHSPAQAQAAVADVWSQLGDGSVLLYRHANAPGIGDPPNFKLGDCSTQRNLDNAGRRQATRIGQALRERGVLVSAVWASPWCRTIETAALAFPAQKVVAQAAFASFFNDVDRRPAQTGDAQALLQAWRGPGPLVVVTHQVNITALTGLGSASGEGVALRWNGGLDGRWQVLGRLPAP